MQTNQISVSYSCKFNDPQKRYMNHNYSAEATATLEPGEDAEKARAALADDLEAFVHGRRTKLYRAAELEESFKEQKRTFGYAVDSVRRYEEGTRQAREKMTEANKLYEELEATRDELSKLGVGVDMPKPFLDVTAAPVLAAAAAAPIDDDEEGNDPDENSESNLD